MEPLNEFYSISVHGQKPNDEYQLENLGIERVNTAFVFRISSDRNRNTIIEGAPIRVTKDDYDGAFAFKLTQVKPPYFINKAIEYHLDFYISNGGSQDTFIKHMNYVIVPYFQQYKYSEVHLQLLNEWIEENNSKNKKTKMSDLNINGNNNVVNNAGGDIHQSGVTINVSESQYKELKELGVDDTHISELREIVSNHSNDKPTFKGRIKKLFDAILVSVASKGLVENLPKLNEFIHHLI